MSYFEDLTDYEYDKNRDGSVNIGWIDINHSYTVGIVNTKFIDKLWEYLSFPINIHRGFHLCELCGKNVQDSVPTASYKGEQRKIGFHEIRVFSHNEKKVYAAPTLIFHYIVEHQYKPPDEFIDAVLNGPDPKSIKYMELIEPFCTHVNKEIWWNIK